MCVVNGVGTINIDGKDYTLKCTPGEYEDFIFMHHGYTAVPKEWVDSVTKQDLIDHPEKFRPYAYARSSYCILTYEEFADGHMDYGYYEKTWSNGIINNLLLIDDYIIWDLKYMKMYYPEFYAKLFPNISLPV